MRKHFHFGPGHHGGGWRRHHGSQRGHTRGRGDLKYEILESLLDGPRHGYDIMLAIEERSGLRPSPGSIYPALQMLEDGDFVHGSERDGKRVYEIGEKGRELLAQREPEGEEARDAESFIDLHGEGIRQLHALKEAAKQIVRSRDKDLYKKAIAVLDRARRELFELLADHI